MLTRILTAIAALALLTGCGRKPAESTRAEPSADKKKVYMVVKASESEFWQIVMAGARRAAKELNVDVTIQAPVSESRIERQISILENAISSKPDAIVLAPSQANPLVPAIEEATDKGIPVIIIDSKADTEKIVSFLASDNIRIGTESADQMAKALTAKTGKPEGKVAAVTFFSGAGSLEKRKKGFEDQIKAKYPGIEIVDFRDAMGKTGETISFVENFLTTYKDLKGIYANNQPTGEETVRALDQAQRKDLAVVVVDAGEQEVWGLENGFVDAMIVQQPWKMGYMGIEYALKAVNGEQIDKFVDTGIVSISPDMLESGEAEKYLDPVKFYSKQK
jgi:ribose transport system substrate-binding protein